MQLEDGWFRGQILRRWIVDESGCAGRRRWWWSGGARRDRHCDDDVSAGRHWDQRSHGANVPQTGNRISKGQIFLSSAGRSVSGRARTVVPRHLD